MRSSAVQQGLGHNRNDLHAALEEFREHPLPHLELNNARREAVAPATGSR